MEGSLFPPLDLPAHPERATGEEAVRELHNPAELLWPPSPTAAQPKHVIELTDLGEFRTEGRALAAFLFWGRGLILLDIRPAYRGRGTGHSSCLC